MKATFTIAMDNSAFLNDEERNDGRELARILRAQADVIDGVYDLGTGDYVTLRDVNGNVVGLFVITE